MKNLFDDSSRQEILDRINKLTADSKPLWGKMSVAQMLAHSILPLELTLTNPKPPRQVLGKILGGLVKKILLSERPFKKSAPAPKSFQVRTPQDFNLQKDRIIEIIQKFHRGCIKDFVHPFMGEMTETQWGQLQYKHLDHHLQQFGV